MSLLEARLFDAGWYVYTHTEKDIYYSKSKLKNLQVVPSSIIKSIDDGGIVYFIPKTKFSRKIFKQYFPNTKTCRNPNKADCVIYDNQVISVDAKYLSNCSVDKDVVKSASYWRHQQVQAGNHHRRYSSPQSGYSDNIHYYTRSEYDNFQKLLKNNKPFIHVDDLFLSVKSNMRDHDLTLAECKKYFTQVSSKDLDSAKSAMQIIANLNPNKYLPMQYLFLSKINDNYAISATEIKKIKSIDILKTFLSGIENFALSNDKIYNLNRFVEIINKNEKFDSNMEYQTVIELILSKGNMANSDLANVSGVYVLQSLNSNKIDVDINELNKSLTGTDLSSIIKEKEQEEPQDVNQPSNHNSDELGDISKWSI